MGENLRKTKKELNRNNTIDRIDILSKLKMSTVACRILHENNIIKIFVNLTSNFFATCNQHAGHSLIRNCETRLLQVEFEFYNLLPKAQVVS